MNKILVFCLFICMTNFIFAEEVTDKTAKAAIGIGPEWNMNSRENFAAGGVIAFYLNIGSSLSFGINATVSTNFDEIIVIEPAANFRWYFLGSDHAGWFVQVDAGAYLVMEDDDLTPLFLGGLRAGLRLPLGETLFVEPFGRLGYPFAFGVGVLAGVRF
ncbi:MAG: hypothetical protein FWD22_02120 [Treponema sp.]|nr:hypothetical protein [Treponema sp.]